MKLALKTFLISVTIGLLISLGCSFALLSYQEIRVEHQLKTIDEVVHGKLDRHADIPKSDIADLSESLQQRIFAGARSNFNIVVLAACAAIILCSAIAYAVIFRISRRIRNLAESAGRIELGDYTAAKRDDAKDELGDLSRSAAKMAEAIQSREEALKVANSELIDVNRALSESEAQLKLMLDSMRSGVILVDAETRHITYANKAAATMVGKPVSELVDSHCCEHFCSTPDQKCPVLEPGYATDDRVRALRRADGSPLYVMKAAVRVDGGGRMRILESMLDITELKKSEDANRALSEQLVQAQKMEAIGTLAGGIAHDFNNMLTPIIGYTELMQLGATEAERAHHLERIHNAATSAAELVQQILTFSRKRATKKECLSLQPILKEAVKLLKAAIPPTIDFQLALPETQLSVFMDPTQVHQIIMNLCANAYHAMEEKGGTLRVELDRIALDVSDASTDLLPPGVYARLKVSDTGCGMGEEVRRRIFEPFFTTKEVGKGTGMGLSVIHGIVEDCKGKITVYSEEGRGSVFNVYLPLAGDASPCGGSVHAPIVSGSGEVLLVDDDQQSREALSDMLKKLGYEVASFANGADAAKAFTLTPRRWKLLITDYMMPGMSAPELIGYVRGLNAELPVLIVTGFAGIGDNRVAGQSESTEILSKPLLLSQLSAAVARLTRTK